MNAVAITNKSARTVFAMFAHMRSTPSGTSTAQRVPASGQEPIGRKMVPRHVPGRGGKSMNFRLGNGSERRKKIEIAAFIGLADVLRVQCAVAARIMISRLVPARMSGGE